MKKELSIKKRHSYKVTIQHTGNPDGSIPADDVLCEFDFFSHDDLFAIMEKLRCSTDLDTASATHLGLAVKLFGGVMLQYRTEELFRNIYPYFSEFMKKLKKQ